MMDLIVAWFATAAAELFEEGANLFSDMFGYDITIFNQTFPIAATAYEIIRSTALALALVLAGWQIFTFFIKGADKAITTPARAALSALVAVAFIFYGNYIFEIIMDFCQYPYTAMHTGKDMDDVVKWGVHFSGIKDLLWDTIAGQSMILYLVVLLMIGFNFMKLLLEIVERYVITFVLVYLSPLASATLASAATNGIFKKYLTMFISQCALIFLNIWCLKTACSGMNLVKYEGTELVIVPLLLVYAFLRISCKMDSYINQLGLNAAVTGAGLGAELAATGMAIMKMGKPGASGGSSGKILGDNPILGSAKGAQTWINRVNPFSATAHAAKDTIVGSAKGASEAYRSAGGLANGGWRQVASGAGHGAVEGFKQSDNIISRIATDPPPTEEDAAAVAQNAISGYRQDLNERLVDKNFDPTNPEAEDLASPAQFNEDIKAWSENSHLAHDGYRYVKSQDATVDNSQKVAAITKGLGLDTHSKEMAEFVNVGFDQADGVPNKTLILDKSGIHGEYVSQDGYQHKMEIRDQSQFEQMTKQAQEGYSMQRIQDGHRYYVKTSKTKLEPAPKET